MPNRWGISKDVEEFVKKEIRIACIVAFCSLNLIIQEKQNEPGNIL